MEPRELLLTAARAGAIYAVMLLVLRLSGKRTIGNFSAFDLLVALMLGEVVDEIIYGDVTFVQGLVPIVAIALLQYGVSWLGYSSDRFDRIIEGTPTVLVRDGELDRSGMRAERLNEKDVLAELRLAGVEDVREVRLATLETDGRVSVLRQEWAEELQKADLESGMARERREARADASGAGAFRTDSPDALR